MCVLCESDLKKMFFNGNTENLMPFYTFLYTRFVFVWFFFGTFLAHILIMIGAVTDVKPLVLVLNISHQFTCPEFAKT